MGRPVGVTILAVLYYLGAASCVVGGIAMIAGGGFIATLIKQQAQSSGAGAGGAGLLAGVGAALGVFFLLVAAVYVLLGWGLWALKNWARIVTVVLCAIFLALQLLGLVTVLTHFNLRSLISSLLWIAVDAVIIGYLLQAGVKAAFQGGQARATSA